MVLERSRRPSPVGVRGMLVLGFLAAAVLAGWQLDLDPAGLWPAESGWRSLTSFFGAAFSPSLVYENEFVGSDAPPLPLVALDAAARTVAIATAAMSLSVVFGLLLGFFASTAWWTADIQGARSPWRRFLRRSVRPTVYGFTRVLIAFLRSIHELLWATLFLVAFGLNEVTGIIAITIPYTGTLAKIFSEMIDEAPRDAALAMRSAGASPLQVFFFGLLPRALPDMSAYAFYRYECALRSSAILGFFGLETLGSFIGNSFREGYYHQGWTYLYVLVALIVVFDWWSGAMRRRFVA